MIFSHSDQDGSENEDSLDEEIIPEKLREKWDNQADKHLSYILCPLCHKQILEESLSCLYCHGLIPRETGLLGKMLLWVKRLLS